MSPKQHITLDDLQQWIAYDPETGYFFWKTDRNGGVSPGTKVYLAKDREGYLILRLRKNGKKKGFYAHRVAWSLYYGRWPEGGLDHKNGCRTDNRIANLREATNQENAKNAKRFSHNTSGTPGVYWDSDKQRWAAEVGNFRHGTRRRRRFKTFEEAVAYRKKLEAEDSYDPLHGLDPEARLLLG